RGEREWHDALRRRRLPRDGHVAVPDIRLELARAVGTGNTCFVVVADEQRGSPLCPSCGAGVAADARFCANCGTRLAQASSPREERKLVSVLFVDLVGFTSRADRADPEDVREELQLYYAGAKQRIEQHGGVLEKFIGDAVMAVFGAPSAHGDDAERAV